jgi:hypothetical protein
MYMSNVNEQIEEPTANPYNSKKSWHTPDAPSRGKADGLFFEEAPQPQATRQQAAPAEDEQESKGRTNYKKRYDDLKKHYDQKIADFKQKELELTAAATEMQPAYAPPKSTEDLESFREQYPDLYETVETVAHLQSEQQVQALKTKMSVIEEREAAIQRREAEETLKSKHPDFYKMENGIQTSSKQKTKKSQAPKSSAADMVSTRTTQIDAKEPKIWSQREIANLSMAQFDKYESEIDQAVMEGRVAP